MSDTETPVTERPEFITLRDDDDAQLELKFRRPTRNHIDRFVTACADGKTSKLQAGERLCFDCLVSPDEKVLRGVFARRPGLPLAIIDELLREAGVSARFTRPPL